jgi:hypothetical protein
MQNRCDNVMYMELGKEEVEDFKQMISVFVLFYKIIWSEVEKQFSELPSEEKHKIFSVIAPSIVQMLNLATDDTEETKSKRKQKARRKKR